jgi:hypothetical protein
MLNVFISLLALFFDLTTSGHVFRALKIITSTSVVLTFLLPSLYIRVLPAPEAQTNSDNYKRGLAMGCFLSFALVSSFLGCFERTYFETVDPEMLDASIEDNKITCYYDTNKTTVRQCLDGKLSRWRTIDEARVYVQKLGTEL